MKMKNMFWAALSMTAALVMAACGSDNDITETPATPQAPKTIPYTVTVSDNVASTRATVKDDPTDRQLYFATGDKLYITGTNIKGVLNLKSGDEGKSSNATFSGNLTYSGEGSPSSSLELTATLVSAQQTVGNQVSVNDAGAVTVNYPTSAYCSTLNDAVQKYSRLTGTSTYGDEAFTLTQQTAFLNFVITFDDGTAAGTQLSTVVSNNGAAICTANVTTVNDGVVKAKFVFPVASGTTLSSATVQMGDKDALAINNATLTGKVYNVNRIQMAAAGAWDGNLADIPSEVVDGSTVTVTNGMTIYGTLSANYKIQIADNATVTLNNVTINGTNNNSYSWAGITCAGDATIILKAGTTNTVKGFYREYAGIYVPANKTLIIKGTGSLNASSNGYGAGIGGNRNSACGNINIQGGTITATGGTFAAGIGGSYEGNCGTITISDGNVTSNGGPCAAGIGGGYMGECKEISISGGNIVATGSSATDGGAGIGSAQQGTCDGITISGGTIDATGSFYAPGIGCGALGDCLNITITNGVTRVTATAGAGNGTGTPHSIGKSPSSNSCGTLTIGGTEYPDYITESPYTYPQQ